MPDPDPESAAWTLFFDGAFRRRSRQHGAGAGAGATLFQGTVNKWNVACFLPSSTHTNNTAEYIALIEGLSGALHHGVSSLTVKGDSALILEQVRGRYSCNNDRLRRLRNKARRLLHRFDHYELIHVDRMENQAADRLANRALDSQRTKTECSAHGIDGVGYSTHAIATGPAIAAGTSRRPTVSATGPVDMDILSGDEAGEDNLEDDDAAADVIRRDRGRTFPVLPVTADSVPVPPVQIEVAIQVE
ncbi:unnamed protein product [Hyaloperonospora brassicae]|uniref:RNase H type-1 domain-containing protein n=1 Tax=Hyaloperonospora brassicae TaxID=162125 RepID=A0AAV0TKR2_HYABA|nr:unnamed protein product [Hyaloperonospora brassicae]